MYVLDRITGLLNHARVAASHVSPVPVDYNAGETNPIVNNILEHSAPYRLHRMQTSDLDIPIITEQRRTVNKLLDFLETLVSEYNGAFQAKVKLGFIRLLRTATTELRRRLARVIQDNQ